MKKSSFRSLELVARNFIDTFQSGTHLSSFKDRLIDVDTVRAYQPGDRKLDSKSSIKTGQIMSRVFNPERSMSIFVILDFSSSVTTKKEQALISSLYFSYLADILYDKIGMLVFGDNLKLVEPSDDHRVVSDLIEDLYRDEINVGKVGNLNAALSAVRNLCLTDTLFVLISDFCFDIIDSDLMMLKQISMGKNNRSISIVLTNDLEWIFGDFNFDLDFFDFEHDTYLKWSSGSNVKHKSTYSKWKEILRMRLRQARNEPIFVEVNDDQFLMPVIRYISRG